jgi:hypothetical protein
MTQMIISSLRLRKENLLDVPSAFLHHLFTAEFIQVPSEDFYHELKYKEFCGLVHVLNQVGKLFTLDNLILIELADSRIFKLEIE